mmetsp:Transcript_118919/g.236989  ORF Transcript_118919/g.236989 Transcript_118919/m.236989 type:complete len:225 (-) Transcript_118919:164-838(-)
MEQPSTGMSTEWARKTARPMARLARCFDGPAAKTTNINKNVPINSPMNAPTNVQPDTIVLLPRPPVKSLSIGNMTFKIAAPTIEPNSCAIKLHTPCFKDNCFSIVRPRVTAQLISLAMPASSNTKIAKPKLSATCKIHVLEELLFATLMALPQPKKTKSDMPRNSRNANVKVASSVVPRSATNNAEASSLCFEAAGVRISSSSDPPRTFCKGCGCERCSLLVCI